MLNTALAIESIEVPEARHEVKVSVFPKMCGMWIEISGDDLKFPSKNRKRIRWRKDGNPFIGKESYTATDEITLRYNLACAGRRPTFGTDLVKLLVMLPPCRNKRWDSHNFTESIADWLQSVGIVEDDSQLEIFPIKRADYDRFASYLGRARYPVFCEDQKTTTLILLKKTEQINIITHAHALELIKLSTGQLELWGTR